MNYLKKAHMLCLDRTELEQMYRQEKQEKLLSTISARGFSLEELQTDRRKMQEVVDLVHAEAVRHKEEVEIFVPLFGHLGMYPKDSTICFSLKDSIDPRKTIIKTMKDLISSIKEASITDFGIMSDDGLRQFQLKQYRGELNTTDLFNFIEEKINHYGGDLGYTNLLVLLQSPGSDMNIDFEELNKRIDTIGIKPDSEILVSYNEEDKIDVINCVYPILATCRHERLSEFHWRDENSSL